MKESFLGYDLVSLSVRDSVSVICSDIFGGDVKRRWLACLNPHSYVVALDDQLFFDALHSADYLVPDGVGVVKGARFLGGSVPERITGSDIFYGIHEYMEKMGGARVFFLGASESTLADIRKLMARDYPNVVVSGTYSPPFKPVYNRDELAEMIGLINDSNADVLWVGMTAPKQEKWIYENISKLDVKFAGAIGAVFDFYTGRVKRSHPLFQKFGLEWLPRLLQQPKRLWRRMFISAPIFCAHVFRARFF